MKILEKILQHINVYSKTASIFYSVSYYFLKYKLKYITFNDAVISTCNSLTHKNYLFTKVIQWGLQEVHKDINIQDNDELKTYFNSFSNSVPYSQSELKDSLLLLQSVTELASIHNSELKIENMCKPINSGSVALIFKGQLNNTSVIIKVLRPNIKNKIEEDIRILLSFFDNIFVKNIINRYLKLNFKTFIESNYDSLLNQCCFNDEVKNAVLFANNLKNKQNIIVPCIYPYFTEKYNDVIVMDYIDGPIAKNVSLEVLKSHFESLQSFFFESLFRYNILHGDFHLGNIIVTKKNTIGIIDFGIVYNLTDDISDRLFDLLFLSLDKKNNKIFLRSIIRFICSDPTKYNIIYTKLENDEEVIELMMSNFSSEIIIKAINKIMSDESIVLQKHICRLFLSVMSGIQTIEYINDNKSLGDLIKSYIHRTVEMD